jgi:membrane associated rhomboid family serine protease
MIPIGDSQRRRNTPFVTYTIAALLVGIYLWDRQGAISGQSVVFADLAMRPRDVLDALTGAGDRFPVVTIFTSLFLHGGIWHLLGNTIYLLAFGPAIEDALGSPRFALFYLFWGIVAAASHIFVDPSSTVPVIGASGAIGGVLGAYFLLFPTNKVHVMIPALPIPIALSAWLLLGGWFLLQLFSPQAGVANWAHAGGFMAGMATVLILGGRNAVLRGMDMDGERDAG